jgi:hypothetical protein
LKSFIVQKKKVEKLQVLEKQDEIVLCVAHKKKRYEETW